MPAVAEQSGVVRSITSCTQPGIPIETGGDFAIRGQLKLAARLEVEHLAQRDIAQLAAFDVLQRGE